MAPSNATVAEQADEQADEPADGRVSARAGQPYRHYGFMLALIVGSRVVDLATQETKWAYWVYNSTICWGVLAIAAAVLSFFAGVRYRSRVPLLMAWLFCGIVGGVTTILTHSAVGVVIGLFSGGLALFERPQKLVMHGLLHTVLPTLAVGLLTGVATALLYVNFGQSSRTGEVTTLSLPLLPAATVLGLILWRIQRSRRWYGWLGSLGLLVCLVPIGFVVTTAVDTYRRDAAMVNVRSYSSSSGFPWLNTLGTTRRSRALLRDLNGLVRPLYKDHLLFESGSGSADIEHVRRFPRVVSLAFNQGSLVNDDDFSRLNTRYVREIRCAARTSLTDKSIRRLDKSKLQHVWLEGPNFTDACLEGLTNVPRLAILSLRGTNVTSAPFNGIDPTSPIYALDLTDTQVDDELFPWISRLPGLRSLHLAGTNVTGRKLKHLRGMSIYLDLSDTPFEERYLGDLLPPKGVKPPFTQPNVRGLSLANLNLSDEAFAVIGQFGSLTSLNVLGSTVGTASLQRIGQLPALRRLTMDGNQLNSENVALVGVKFHLNLVYDANAATPSEICKAAEALWRSRRESGMGSLHVSIRNAKLSEEVVARLMQAERRFGRIGLPDARLPDGRIESFNGTTDLTHLFPEVFSSHLE